MCVFKLKTFTGILIFIFSLTISNFTLTAQIDWDTTIDIAPSSFGNHHPRIATNASGNPVVIWGKSNNLMYSRLDGTEFTVPIPLNPDNISIAEGSWMGPDIASHGDTIYIVYKQTPEASLDSHIWCISSFDGGLSFSTPVRVDDIGDGKSRFPTITTDDSGNPIIGFMKFESNWGDPRWVVTKSSDFGNSFSPDVLASGWSGASSEACDCCPGTITSSGNNIAMLYRDNNENIRDTWAGISTDVGVAFNEGMNVDQLNWLLSACPSSGPDGIIIGDTLYTTFMSAASFSTRVYLSKSSISQMNSSTGNPLGGSISGLEQQNFPRIANLGNATAIAWKQVVNGESQLAITFAEDIQDGIPDSYETIAFNSVNNADITLGNDNILAVWQDNNSGTVKYRLGMYSSSTSLKGAWLDHGFTVYPNPSSNRWILTGSTQNKTNIKIELFDIQGRLVQFKNIETNGDLNIEIENSDLNNGTYVLKISNEKEQASLKLIKK